MIVRWFACVAARAFLSKGARPDPDSGMLTRFPFGAMDDLRRGRKRPEVRSNPLPFAIVQLKTDVTLHLRIDSLTIDRRSRETFLLFGLQGSRLNICYYHQDLH